MKPEYLFFDLDGTLVDSAQGILNAVSYSLRKRGFSPIPPDEDLRFFIGPPLKQSFMKLCGVSPEEGAEYVGAYREYYREKGIFECKVYEGITDLLKEAEAAGYRCVLATCKPTVFAKRVVERFGLDRYFCFLSGSEFDGTRGEKEEVIAYAAEKLGIDDPQKIVMIGDRSNDAAGANICGTRFCGVLWGFGSAEELREAGGELLFSTPKELKTYLLNLRK